LTLTVRYRWVVLAIGTCAQGVLAGLLQAVPVLAPELRDTFGLSLGGIGVLLFLATGGQIFTQLAWGMLNDRFGERLVLPAGLGVAGASLTVAAIDPVLEVVAGALLVAGMFATSVSAATGRAIMGWFDARQRGFALGIRQSAIPLGAAAAALVLPLASSIGGLSAAFGLLAASCALFAVLAIIGLREPPIVVHQALDGSRDPLRDRKLWRLTGGSALLTFLQGAVLGFTVLYFHVERGLSAGYAAGLLAAINLTGAGVRLAIGAISDRTGRRIVPLQRIALVLAALTGLTAIAMGSSNAVLIPVFFVAGTLTVSWNGLLVTATAEQAGRARTGTALGFQQTALSVVFAGTGPLFAVLISSTSWRAAVAALVLMPLCAAAVFRPLSRSELARGKGRPVETPVA
jgi:sugar phosphate permease